MSRVWQRWIALGVFVVVLGTAFVLLGRWQLDRLDERRERNAIMVAHRDAPVVDYREVFTRPITEEDQWQRVSVTGHYTGEQWQVRYRSNDGRTGFEVVAVMETTNGDLILIDRGFVAGNNDQVAVPPPPEGEVTIVGHVRRNEQGRNSAMDPSQGGVRLINSDRLSAASGLPLINGYIGALESDPADHADFTAVLLPELSDGPHFWYAVQWFMFTGIAVTGLVVFIRGDIRQRKGLPKKSRFAGFQRNAPPPRPEEIAAHEALWGGHDDGASLAPEATATSAEDTSRDAEKASR